MAHQQFRDKMASEGLSEAFITSFLQCYTDLVEGKTGMMPENSIEPVDNLPNFSDLPESNETALLGETVILKLNGGLGTSMGLEKAKSLLPVKGDDTFLDFIAKQVLHMRKEYQMPLKFVLLNSFSTSDDTRAFLTKYPELSNDPEVELIQNKSPKVHAKTLEPAQWPKNPSLEWCPPGHGDLYAALVGSGKLASLLSQGVKYMFVSNSDNLGATLDLRLLSYFAKSGSPMTMEVCERTESDKKGGHLCRDKSGKLTLRESAQCAKEDEPAFQDITKHRYFNTNNLWLNLPKLQEAIQAAGGYLPLPLIRNAKTVDPRDPNSDPVYQLETAMGAAIGSLEGAQAIIVPRTRFAPVKTCNDLFVLRSDCYTITEDYRLIPSPGANIPVVDLDSKLYKLVDNIDPLVPNGVPSLKNCKRLKVSGPLTFDANVVLEGEVEIISKGPSAVVTGHINNQTITL